MFGHKIENYLSERQIDRRTLAETIGVSENAFAEMLAEHQLLPAELYFLICRELHLPPDFFSDTAECAAQLKRK